MPKIANAAFLTLKKNAQDTTGKTRWHGTALLIEAVVILAIVIIAISVFVKLFGYSYTANRDDARQAQAITLAANKAEAFAADPAHVALSDESPDGYTTNIAITPTQTGNGTLYKADIEVFYQGRALYELSTSRYVSANESGAGA